VQEFEPILLWAVAALPLLGFLVNGAAAFLAPGRKTIPTVVGPGVVGLAFLIAVLNFLGLRGAELYEPLVQRYWQWLVMGGLEIDVSVDFVNVKHPGTGKLETKYMVEMEIDHQYINAPGSSSRSSSSSSRPTNLRSFSTESEQKRWAGTLTGAAQLNGLPRFHELPDLADKAIWQTPEQKETEKAIDKLFPILFPGGATPSKQKGVAMATTLGLI